MKNADLTRYQLKTNIRICDFYIINHAYQNIMCIIQKIFYLLISKIFNMKDLKNLIANVRIQTKF